jgi:hypothetical protein
VAADNSEHQSNEALDAVPLSGRKGERVEFLDIPAVGGKGRPKLVLRSSVVQMKMAARDPVECDGLSERSLRDLGQCFLPSSIEVQRLKWRLRHTIEGVRRRRAGQQTETGVRRSMPRTPGLVKHGVLDGESEVLEEDTPPVETFGGAVEVSARCDGGCSGRVLTVTRRSSPNLRGGGFGQPLLRQAGA